MAHSASARLRFEPPICLMETTGGPSGKIQAISPLLAAAKISLLESGKSSVPDWEWIDRPRRLMDGYNRRRATSDLFAILKSAHRLRDTIDRVVVVGTTADLAAAQALMGACADPYFNDLDRGGRGSRARLHFVGDDLDNDRLQALLRLLGEGRPAVTLDQRWALVAVLPRQPNLNIALAIRHLLAALWKSTGGDRTQIGERFIPVGGPSLALPQADWERGQAGCASHWATQFGCVDAFPAGPAEPCGPFAALAAPSLLPAALLGIDIVRLLTGAVAFTDQFVAAPIGANPALDFAAAAILLADSFNGARSATGAGAEATDPPPPSPTVPSDGPPAFFELPRPLSLWAQSLQQPARWWETLFAASRRCGFVTHIMAEEWRSDPLGAVDGDFPDRPPVSLTNRTFPELMLGAAERAFAADRLSGRPVAILRFPRVDEWSLGQFFQMMMIAVAVEQRVLDSLQNSPAQLARNP